jgi:hypothetical protein
MAGPRMRHPVVVGLIAGAAGTTALNLVSYFDMTMRGRAASSLPAQAAADLSGDLGLPLGTGESKSHREEGLGALLGYATGLGVGAGYGLVRTQVRVPAVVGAVGLALAAMAASDAPMTALGLTDPRSWAASSWVADALPHLAFGLTAAATFRFISG